MIFFFLMLSVVDFATPLHPLFPRWMILALSPRTSASQHFAFADDAVVAEFAVHRNSTPAMARDE